MELGLELRLCVSSLISNQWCNQYQSRISSKNKIWFNKALNKLLKSDSILLNNCFNCWRKTIDCLSKQSTEFLRYLSINSWCAFWNRHEVILNHFLIKELWVFKERKMSSCFVIKIILFSYIKNWNLIDPGALNWLRLIHHWSDHQTKPSIPFLYYFCNLV